MIQRKNYGKQRHTSKFQLHYLEYKYLIFRDEIFDKWEDIETNRKVAIPEKEKLVFSDEDNNPETNIKKHYAKNKKKGGYSSKNLKSSSKSNSKSKKLKKVSSAKKVSKKSKNKISNLIQMKTTMK